MLYFLNGILTCHILIDSYYYDPCSIAGLGLLSPPSITIKREDGFEGGSDVEEEYFEEFHLPNTHENAFVRHKSFRRKVQLTPINAPDAEKIEDLVRAGELYRHGSIRRRITSETDLPKLDPNHNFRETDSDEEKLAGTFERDIKEIENLLNEENGNSHLETADEVVQNSNSDYEISSKNQGITSTPKSMLSYEDSRGYGMGDLSVSLVDSSQISEGHDDTNDTSISIEQSTLMKIRDCLDVSRYKDMYNLSGRLQDILTPLEVEEVLNNSDRYAEYIDQDVIEALSNSLQEQNTDSGISSPEAKSTDSELNKEKNTKEEEESGQLLERRRSIRISRSGSKDIAIEGIFVESNSKNPNLKKIEAPVLDFDASTNDDDYFPISDTTKDTPIESPNDNSMNDIPKIRIIRSASQYDESDLLANCSSLAEITGEEISSSHDDDDLDECE